MDLLWMNLEDLGFPDYAVSDFGDVRNERTGRLLRQSRNQAGVYKIGMMHQHFHAQQTVSVALLVAHMFLPDPQNENFNSAINLDGNRSNNQADNLMWRPRWFVIKYHKQFHNKIRGFAVPVMELHTQETFDTSWEAAIKYGLIDRDIYVASLNRVGVFPTGQMFHAIR
jgi:NUMOD4 motif